MNSLHLTEDELDEILIADGRVAEALDDDRAEHYFACAHCRARQQDLTAPLDAFNQASMAWSVARSNTLNRDLSQAAAQQRHAFSFADFGAVTAALLMGLALFATQSFQHPAARPSAPSAATSFAHAPRNTAVAEVLPAVESKPARLRPAITQAAPAKLGEIDTDNEMLLAIDSALSTPEPSPAELYHAGEAPVNPSQFDDDRVND